MIRRILIVTVVLFLIASHRWTWLTAEQHGRQSVQLEVASARAALEAAHRQQFQFSREAAIQIRSTEVARTAVIRDGLDELSEIDRHVGITHDALGLLRSIK